MAAVVNLLAWRTAGSGRALRAARRLSGAVGPGKGPPNSGRTADEVDAQLSAVLSNVREQLEPVPGVSKGGPKFLLQFTCAHAGCELPDAARTTRKIISQKAYRDGVVLVQCGCSKLHLIADHLSWFGDRTDIEAILAEKGETVVRTMLSEESLQLE